MSSDREVTRIVRSWMDEGVTALPDRVLDAVLDQVPATPQRRPMRRRIADMQTLAKFAIAAAAVLVVAVVGFNLLSASGRPEGSGSATSPSSSPSASPRPSHSPRPSGVTFQGDFTIGRHSLAVDGIGFSFNVPSSDWEPFGSLYISKSTHGPQGAEAVIFWTNFPNGADVVPCANLLGPPIGPTAADLAAAVSTAPGTELVTGPPDVTVGGRAAKHMVLTVRDDLGCDPGFFYNWKAQTGGAMWQTTDAGDTIRIWIVDLDGTRLFIEGETHKDAGLRVEQEIQQIVESIRFE